MSRPGEDRLAIFFDTAKKREVLEEKPKKEEKIVVKEEVKPKKARPRRRPKEEKVKERKDFLREAVEFGLRKPIVSVNSPVISAILHYLSQEDPRFKKSRFVKEILMEGVRRKYPSLLEKVIEEIAEVKAEKAIERMI